MLFFMRDEWVTDSIQCVQMRQYFAIMHHHDHLIFAILNDNIGQRDRMCTWHQDQKTSAKNCHLVVLSNGSQFHTQFLKMQR